MRSHGVPDEVLTDNGKVFTGRHSSTPSEVLFDRICRQNGITHRLTGVRSPTTTGKIERFHRTLRDEFLADAVLTSLGHAQAELDAWVARLQQDPAPSSDRYAHPRRTIRGAGGYAPQSSSKNPTTPPAP